VGDTVGLCDIGDKLGLQDGFIVGFEKDLKLGETVGVRELILVGLFEG
jgi:hypothetical protein